MLHRNTLSAAALAAALLTLGLAGTAVAAEDTAATVKSGKDSSAHPESSETRKHDATDKEHARMSKGKAHKDSKEDAEEEEEASDADQEESAEDDRKS